MKGYYIHYRDINDPASNITGSDKKVKGQIATFNKAGLNCEFLFCPHPEKLLPMVKSCIPGCSDGVKWPNPEIMKEVDYLYIRKPRFFSKDFVEFLSCSKQINPNLLIICEIPTYPYDREMLQPKTLLAYRKDKKYRNKLNGLVDFFSDLSDTTTIFGLPTIPFYNGIDLDSIRTKKATAKDETLNIISVAYFEFWHGIDRFIEGMKEYCSKSNVIPIHLHLVGDGGAIPEIKKMVEKDALGSYVTFYGSLMPSDIEPIYDKCQFGISSLGMHRLNPNMVASSLKSREYLAKGLPFAYSSKIDVFEKFPNDFCLELPASEEPIHIQQIVEHYKKLIKSKSNNDLIQQIRKYAENTVSMNIAMSEVIDLIKAKECQND